MTIPALVPQPTSVREIGGDVAVPDVVTIASALPVSAWQRRSVEDWLGAPAQVVDSGAWLTIARDDALPDGAYRLVIDEGVHIDASSAAGTSHALQTLRQFAGPEAFSPAPRTRQVRLARAEVDDAPRFDFRGVHYDVARHFSPTAELLRFIDLAAAHKLNALHLHLTEDQGWRMQIDAFPRLTEVASEREDSLIAWGPDGTEHYAGRPHGGFYTKQDLREVVAFAAERGITVIPEIDVPGHSVAAIAAYPRLGVGAPDVDVWTGWGVNDCILEPSDFTIDFFTTVLDEVMDVFPSPVIHVGGDEVPYRRWQESADVRQRATDVGLGSVEELHGWFLAQLVAHIESRGRRAGVWHEAVSEQLPTTAVVNAWSNADGVAECLAAGYDTVVSCCSHLYLDYRPSDSADEPSACEPVLPMRKLYEFDALTPEMLAATERGDSRVAGIQAQLWTEWLDSQSIREYMAYPRLAAFAELAWSETRDYDDFENRLRDGHVERLDAAGVDYRPLDGPRARQLRPDIRALTGR